jgi:hypothetical protein
MHALAHLMRQYFCAKITELSYNIAEKRINNEPMGDLWQPTAAKRSKSGVKIIRAYSRVEVSLKRGGRAEMSALG